MDDKKEKAQVLGLTRNNARYKNVSDDLKWAIPLVEYQRTPEFIAAQKIREEESQRRVEKEMAARRRPLRIIKSDN